METRVDANQKRLSTEIALSQIILLSRLLSMYPDPRDLKKGIERELNQLKININQ